MKKSIIIFSAALMLISVGCKENAYKTYENPTFHIEYPKTWDAEDSIFEVLPFAAYGPTQMVAIRTRLLDSVPEEERNLDAFAQSRITDFEQNIVDFNLQQLEKVEDGVILHYSSGKKESETSNYYETLMKLTMKGNKFYGISCEAANDAEKDTADHIVRSFCLK